jgi:hypothetical protein
LRGVRRNSGNHFARSDSLRLIHVVLIQRLGLIAVLGTEVQMTRRG